jgi:hypothetical protein
VKKFYDAHIHIHILSSDIKSCLAILSEGGLSGFAALIITEYPADETKIKKMVPAFFHEHVSLDNFAKDKTVLPILNQFDNFNIWPYLDTRFIDTNIEEKIDAYRHDGFKGLKLLYVPEEDPVLKIGGMKQAFGRNQKVSEKITSLLIDSASRHHMPILLHIDLRRYADFAADVIEGHPGINFNIAHFGFSRRKVAYFLDKYSNCFTDSSGLTPYMEKEPDPYLDFITYYQDKILFGSDTIIHSPHTVHSEKNAIVQLIKDPGIHDKILFKNYVLFHNM